MKREKSNIKVHVINLDKLLGEALRKFNSEHTEKPATRMYIRGNLGYIEKDGAYWVLDDDGVGSDDPITSFNPLEVPIFPDFGNNEIHLEPVFIARIDDLKTEKVEYECDLSEFIRTFGRRLEANFTIWKEKFADAQKNHCCRG